MPTNTITLPSQPELIFCADKNGVWITEKSMMQDDQTIFINNERLGDVVAFLHRAQAKVQKKEWRE